MFCNYVGSEQVACTINAERPWDNEYKTLIQRSFGLQYTPPSRQYSITYYDYIEEKEVTKWVNDNLLTINSEIL